MVDTSHSPLEWGAIASAAVLVLGAFGRGVIWLSDRLRQRSVDREAKLDRREADLDEHEVSYRKRIEARLAAFEERDALRQREHTALRLAFELVAGALRARDPDNSALRQAEQLLSSAFPLDPIVPPDMAAQLGTIERVAAKLDRSRT